MSFECQIDFYKVTVFSVFCVRKDCLGNEGKQNWRGFHHLTTRLFVAHLSNIQIFNYRTTVVFLEVSGNVLITFSLS